MDYNLVSLGPNKFENLVVALCLAELGPGSEVYGAGPDGGRELTYTGLLNMPGQNDAERWTGYTVVQAKHRARNEGGGSDVSWLIEQLRREFASWRNSRADSKLPDNYILVTNIKLSGVAHTGGIDKVETAMRELAQEFTIRNWAIWHNDKVCRLLDLHVEIRQTYLGEIVTGDVLHALNDHLLMNGTTLEEAIHLEMVEAVVTQHSLRLTQAGRGPSREYIADVGIDLPAVIRGVRNGSDDARKPILQSLFDHGDSVNADELHCIVISGGPGQGKSTIGQMLCQGYRAVALDESGPALSSQTTQILAGIRKRFAEIGVSLPQKKRWPLYLKLSDVSDFLAQHHKAKILTFIADKVSEACPFDVSEGDIFEMLGAYPWVVVLDGLDEVPDPSARYALLMKISNFVGHIRHRKGDVLIVATTRPQGYDGEFSDLSSQEFDLAPLYLAEALSYASQLALSRYREDPAFAKELAMRVEKSSRQGSARLMSTPLQVSILTSLLEERVRAPQTRHALFHEYYETLFRRETSKAGAKGELLERHKFDVDTIHDHIGLALQKAGENSGSAETSTPRSELHKVTYEHLTGLGHDVASAEKLAKEIVGLTTDRLVLLAEIRSQEFGFEVRSLQEYIASRAITSGRDEEVMERLTCLLPSTHWRNTWLFAIARTFDMRPHLRDSILRLIGDANIDSTLHMIIKPGCSASIDLLADGLAAPAPKYRQALLVRALEMMDGPSSFFPDPEVVELETRDNEEAFRLARSCLVASVHGRKRARINIGFSIDQWMRMPSRLGSYALRFAQVASEAKRPVNELGYSEVFREMKDIFTASNASSALIHLFDVMIASSKFESDNSAFQPGLLEQEQTFVDALMAEPAVAEKILAYAQSWGDDLTKLYSWFARILRQWDQRRSVGNFV